MPKVVCGCVKFMAYYSEKLGAETGDKLRLTMSFLEIESKNSKKDRNEATVAGSSSNSGSSSGGKVNNAANGSNETGKGNSVCDFESGDGDADGDAEIDDTDTNTDTGIEIEMSPETDGESDGMNKLSSKPTLHVNVKSTSVGSVGSAGSGDAMITPSGAVLNASEDNEDNEGDSNGNNDNMTKE